MKHALYPSYRPSGVEWLGDVPEHWKDTLVKRCYDIQLGKMLQPEASNTHDFETPYLRAANVHWHKVIVEEPPTMWVNEDDIERFGVAKGDLLVCEGGEGGRAALTERTLDGLIIQNALHRVRAEPSSNNGFLMYWLAALASSGWFEASNNKATIAHFTKEKFGALPLSAPPSAEQQAIAAFLDHETAKVDALGAKKKQLIERLAEYRTALIAWTVTKGLPPDVAQAKGLDPSPRLKPAGAEWLGDVPEHWDVVENRRVFRERDERSVDGEGELLTVSHITGVTRRSEKPDVGMFMAETLENYKRCYRGDLVINTMWAWMGAAGAAKEPGLVSPSYNVYMPDRRRLLPRFVDLAYRSSRYVLGMTSESRGIWSSRLRLYPQHFLSLITAVPPLREQEAIIAHVDAMEMRLERLSEMVCTAIERLQEYRSALITAAVTGKIDVRDYAAVEAEGSAA